MPNFRNVSCVSMCSCYFLPGKFGPVNKSPADGKVVLQRVLQLLSEMCIFKHDSNGRTTSLLRDAWHNSHMFKLNAVSSCHILI